MTGTRLDKVVHRLNRVANPLSRWLNSAGIGIVLLMMFLITADVILRYFFKSPILGSSEMIEFAMIITVFFAVAYTMVQKAHISVDVLTSKLSPRGQSIMAFTTTLVGFCLFALTSWQSVLFALAQWDRGVTSPVLHVPIPPLVLIVAFGCALLSLVLLTQLFNYLSRALKQSNWKDWLALALGVVVAVIVVTSPVWLQQLPVKLSPSTVGFIVIALLVVLVFSGMPIGFVLALVGLMGMTYLSGVSIGISLLGRVPYSTTASTDMSVLPLFILMGALCFHSGMSREIYYTVYKWIGNMPGGLAMATIGACAIFAAVSGTSVATTATMGTVALPEMKRYRYDSALAAGCIAAGGCIGILIPPSVIMVIYGILTGQSIGKLLIAGFLPGVLEALVFMLTIYILCKRNPLLGPTGESASLASKITALRGTWAVLVLFLLVIGGIYVGIFTPTEAAGIGAFGAFVIALGRRQLTWKGLTASLGETGETTAMAFIILIGSMVLGYFLTATRLPFEVAKIVTSFEINRYIVLGLILVVYLFLGCIMSAMAMVIITVPIFFPIIMALGFDPIWFGVIIVIMCEVGQITPPVGISVFVIQGVAKTVPMYTIFRGIIPFLIADFAMVALLTVFPQIVLVIPNLMK